MLTRYIYYLCKLRSTLRMEPNRLREIENKRMRAAIRHAYEHVPFYRRKFREAGVKPDYIQSVEDISRIPVTTKAELQARPFADLLANTVRISDCIRQVTSGSTGVPLTIVVDKQAEDFRSAMWARAYAENGLRFTDKLATITDPRLFTISQDFVKRLRSPRKREISIFNDPQYQSTLLETFKPDVIKGYSSSLEILADFYRKRGRKFNPHHIFTGAELLRETERKLIISAFGCDVIDYYGSTEFSLLGWECQNHEGYHLNIEGTLIEFVKNNEAVSPGERGELVCTSLINYAMPLIRYEIGDIGVSIEEPCSCGRSLPLLRILNGRTGDFLTTLDGRKIPPTAFSPYPFDSLEGIRQFRIVQETNDRMVIQLVFDKDLPEIDSIMNRAKLEIQRVFGEQMQVDFRILEKIDRDSTGKLRKIVSRVPTVWK